MSELTPEELVEEINYDVEDADVIPIPVDPTLTHEGEAADAKATGDAIRALGGAITVNGKQAVAGVITVYGTDIKIDGATGAQTVTASIQEVAGRDATGFPFETSTPAVSIKDKINSVDSKTADDILIESDSSDTIGNAIDILEAGLTAEEISDIYSEVFGGETE